MSATLSTATNFLDILKYVYEPRMSDMIVTESEAWDLFTAQEGFEVTDGPDGKSIQLLHVFSGGGGISFMGENDYLPDSTDPNVKQSSVTIKQVAAPVEISGRVMRRVKAGPAAFADWAREVLPLKVERLVTHQDRALFGSGTGIVARVSAAPSGVTIPLGSNFGIAGLTGAEFSLYEGDSIRLAADAAGATLRAGAAIVQSVNYDTPSITVDTMPTSAASADYIFLGGANTNGAGQESMGLEGIIDDGTNVPTFQGLARATYPRMSAQIVDAQTTGPGFNGVLGEDLLEFADRRSWERGKGQPDVLLASRGGRASFWKNLKDDRRINDPAGNYVGGRANLRMILGDRVIELKVARKCAGSRAYLVQRNIMAMFRLGPGRWDDTTGSVWDRTITSTGRKDAFWAIFIHEFEVACRAPNKNVKVVNLTPQ